MRQHLLRDSFHSSSRDGHVDFVEAIDEVLDIAGRLIARWMRDESSAPWPVIEQLKLTAVDVNAPKAARNCTIIDSHTICFAAAFKLLSWRKQSPRYKITSGRLHQQWRNSCR